MSNPMSETNKSQKFSNNCLPGFKLISASSARSRIVQRLKDCSEQVRSNGVIYYGQIPMKEQNN